MDPRLDEIAIYLGPGWEAFSALDIETKGLAGSETAAVRLAEQLSALGHAVAVYGEVEKSGHGGVAYYPHANFDPAEHRLAVISSRRPELFDLQVNARSRLLWMHDTDCGAELDEGRAGWIDHVLVLSRWHRDRMRDLYPFLGSKLCQIRNGIEVGYFQGEAPKRSRRLLYTSAPDRGLDILLEMWPQIRERVPDAELGFSCTGVYDRIADGMPHVARHRAHCIELAESREGTHDFGALSQPDLARLMRSSMVWAHPSWSTPGGVPFYETSCIGAMEAQAAGCLVVASATAALPETVRVGRLVGGEPLSPRWRETFVEEICAGLLDQETQSWAKSEAPAAASRLGWDDVARMVASLIDSAPPAAYDDARRPGSRSKNPREKVRDAEILVAEVERNPYDPRAAFDLAQSLLDAAETQAALAACEQRIAMAGLDEEAFISEMRAGEICEALDEPWERARDFYLDAYRRRPHRAEPLHALARNRRLADEFEEAYRYARRAASIPYPDGEDLSVTADVYAWRGLDELAVAAALTGRSGEALEVSERLLAGDDLPDAERPRIEANRDFAVPALGSLAEALVGTLELGTHTTWPVAQAKVIGASESGVAIEALATDPAAPGECLLLSVDLDPELNVASIEPAAGRPAHSVMEVEVDRGTLRVEQPGPHRLVLSDESGCANEASTRFWLAGAGESCGGIARIGDRLVLVFDTPGGVRFAALDLDQALAMLAPLDPT